MPHRIKPLESAKALKLKIKDIEAEMKIVNAVLKRYEQESLEVQSIIESHANANAYWQPMLGISQVSPDAYFQTDLQMLLWRISDNTEHATVLKSDLAERASKKQRRKEQLESELTQAILDLKYFSVLSRLSRLIHTLVSFLFKHSSHLKTIRDDLVGCFRAIQSEEWSFGEYVRFTPIPLLLISFLSMVLSALSGSISIALAPAIIFSIVFLWTAWSIAKNSGRPRRFSLLLVAALFPLAFRILPIVLPAYLIACTIAPQVALKRQIDNYFTTTVVPVSQYWHTHFSDLDMNNDGLATTEELRTLLRRQKAPVLESLPYRTSLCEGETQVELPKVLDTDSTKNMLEHLQLHWTAIGHPVKFKPGPDPSSTGKFIPQEFALSKDDLDSCMGRCVQTTP